MTRTSSDEGARVVLGVGSNLGDRLGFLRAARRRLAKDAAVRIVAASAVYETEPRGGPPQGDYLNACLLLLTSKTPRALLELAQAVEAEAGRVRGPTKNEPRTLDLDLLLWGDAVVNDAHLAIPHPRLTERAFALVPAADVAAGFVVPGVGATLAALAARAGVGGMRRFCGPEDWR
jgi:2-amino-4-hydroxy-6-hydroxymethyldihydropteridine diphosphokinase